MLKMVSLRSFAEDAMQSPCLAIRCSASIIMRFSAKCLLGGISQGAPSHGEGRASKDRGSAGSESQPRTLTAQVACKWFPPLLCPLFPAPREPCGFRIISCLVSECSKGSPLPDPRAGGTTAPGVFRRSPHTLEVRQSPGGEMEIL